MKKLLALLLSVVLLGGSALVFTACADDDGPPEGVPVITMMFWGGLEEKDAVEEVAANWNAVNGDRFWVHALHVPNVDYAAVLATMIAEGNAPDIGYLGAACSLHMRRKAIYSLLRPFS
jgi:ABC-type glycerol-3-phosphate transport system substrate-binding protein